MTGWLVETFAAVTAAMLLVLALRRPVARAFGAGWAYALWLIPALRLVLPPLGLISLSLSPAGSVIPPAGGVTALPPAEAGPGQWVPFMLASWAGGAVIFLILQWLGYRAFLGRLNGDARPARPPFYAGIATLVSRVVEGPVALGLFRRLIVVPADFSRRYSPAERRLAMEHERTHHVRGDLWWNVAALLVLALNWFNPIAWIAFRAFRADQELACDAAVAARADAAARCDYARALVKAASSPGLVAACPMSASGDLKRRLRMLARHRTGPLRRAGGGAAVAAIALAGFAVGAGSPPVPTAPAAPVRPVAAAPAPVAAAPAAQPAEDVARPVHPAAAHKAATPPVELALNDDAPPPEPAETLAPLSPPAPLDDAPPAAAPEAPVVTMRTARLAALDELDPALRARVEAALARAVAEKGARTTLRYAVAESGTQSLFVVRLKIQHTNQGE